MAYIVQKLKFAKQLVRPMSKKRRFRTTFHSQYVKLSETLVKSLWQHFYDTFSSIWVKLLRDLSPLMICEILGRFIYTLFVDEKYYLHNSEI